MINIYLPIITSMLFPAFFLHQVYKGQNDTGESRDHDLFRRAQLLGNPSLQAECTSHWPVSRPAGLDVKLGSPF